MSNRKAFKQTIAKWGATFEEDKNDRCRSIFIDAPEGKEWAATTASVIMAIHWFNGGTASEMYAQAIEDMNQGFSN